MRTRAGCFAAVGISWRFEVHPVVRRGLSIAPYCMKKTFASLTFAYFLLN